MDFWTCMYGIFRKDKSELNWLLFKITIVIAINNIHFLNKPYSSPYTLGGLSKIIVGL